MKSKLHLRQHYNAVRNQIDMPYREQAALLAAKNFITTEIFERSQHIACYLGTKQELDTAFLIEAIWQANKKCYLPIVADGSADKGSHILKFVRYNKGDTLCPNRYSILEPVDITAEIAPQALDIVIAPLVAFDLSGHRLGTGGGYYDKTFAFLSTGSDHLSKRPYLMGFAFADQQSDLLLPVDPWDIPLDGVVTEKAIQLLSVSHLR